MAFVSHQQKVLFRHTDSVVFMRGERVVDNNASPFFAYMVLTFDQLSHLNRDMESGQLVRLGEYGRVVLQGNGEPSEDQKHYMERYFAFDHTDYFSDDEDNGGLMEEEYFAQAA